MDKRRENQSTIMTSARSVFLQKGIANTVMSDIASHAGLSVRTLYRYFETKDDIAFEIAISLLMEWNQYQEDVYKQLCGTGIEIIDKFLMELIGYMENNRDVIRYLSEFDFYFNDENKSRVHNERFNRYQEITLYSDDLLSSILKTGKIDKSIKISLDESLTVATISNVLWGFGQRIAVRGDIIEAETGYKPIQLIKKQVDIYIDFMRG